MSDSPIDIVQVMYGFLAILGGVARYLKSYIDGAPFSLSVFLASAVVSGFSGYMFALMGISMNMPQPIIYMMSGTGGFMGDQSMKLVFEWLQSKAA